MVENPNLDDTCSTERQQVYQFQSNFSQKKEPQIKLVSVIKIPIQSNRYQ